MPSLTWKDEYSVGIAEIDSQHKRMLTIISELLEAKEQGKSVETLEKTFGALINYALKHFVTEEKYFIESNYPDTETHRAQHLSFMEEVIRLQANHEGAHTNISPELIEFLTQWWTDHILKQDMKYSPHLRVFLAA